MVGGSCLFEPSIPKTELRAVWADIIYAKQELHTERIFIERDFATIIACIQDKMKQRRTNPLLYDIRSSLYSATIMSIHHVFQEANSAVDWIASYIVDWTGISLYEKREYRFN